MSKHLIFDFHQDGGHAWLKVSKKLFNKTNANIDDGDYSAIRKLNRISTTLTFGAFTGNYNNPIQPELF